MKNMTSIYKNHNSPHDIKLISIVVKTYLFYYLFFIYSDFLAIRLILTRAHYRIIPPRI
jgi:hypothetical protein